MKRSTLRLVIGLLILTMVPSATALGATSAPHHATVRSVVVRAHPGRSAAAAAAVRAAGGHVTARIRIIHALAADVPAAALAGLARDPAIVALTADARVTLQGAGVDGTDAVGQLGSMYSVRHAIGADRYWDDGYTGKGVGVALIDSGVAPVLGLTTPGKVINGPDLSFESQDLDLRYLDTYGHGTHLAGIIAGRDPGAGGGTDAATKDGSDDLDPEDQAHFLGIAPDAHIISLKVADAFGGTDVSQVLAAIDWVVQHRDDPGLNIRVLNLSFGTDGVQKYTLDPLAYAVEVAWRKGIFVVVAAGNAGFGSRKLNNPAIDPFIMAVGASDHAGTADTDDDIVAAFSSTGDRFRHPDLVAPGRSIVSLRAPGSFVDQHNPGARVGDTPRFLRGSGTSQSAAVVSGAAALVIEQRPGIKPDRLKALLTRSAQPLEDAHADAQGHGLIDLKEAREDATPAVTQAFVPATGLGSLEASRGSYHLEDDGETLQGSRDIFGHPFVSALWAPRSLLQTSWIAGKWMDYGWAGSGWSADSWSGPAWSGRTWSSDSWSGRSWSSSAWAGRTWSAGGWTGGAWTGRTWTSDTWSGHVWSGSVFPAHD